MCFYKLFSFSLKNPDDFPFFAPYIILCLYKSIRKRLFMTVYNFYSYILHKNVRRGVCLGFGVSLKNYAVKYLFCSSSDEKSTPEFALNFSAVERIDNNEITLSVMRPVFPKSHVKIFKDLPVYTLTGAFVGNVTKLQIDNNTLVKIYTDLHGFSPSDIYACSDAIILKKVQSYPLGQRVPATPNQDFLTQKSKLVTKPLLRFAIEKNALIKLTLSLAPFHFQDF